MKKKTWKYYYLKKKKKHLDLTNFLGFCNSEMVVNIAGSFTTGTERIDFFFLSLFFMLLHIQKVEVYRISCCLMIATTSIHFASSILEGVM